MNKIGRSMGYPFLRPNMLSPIPRVIIEDLNHSEKEERFFCLGKVKSGIMTVRFTERQGRIRIFGAGYWRKGRKIYDQKNQIH